MLSIFVIPSIWKLWHLNVISATVNVFLNIRTLCYIMGFVIEVLQSGLHYRMKSYVPGHGASHSHGILLVLYRPSWWPPTRPLSFRAGGNAWPSTVTYIVSALTTVIECHRRSRSKNARPPGRWNLHCCHFHSSREFNSPYCTLVQMIFETFHLRPRTIRENNRSRISILSTRP